MLLRYMSVLMAFAFVSLARPATAEQIGPSFDCHSAQQPLAQMLCADPDLSRTDLRFAQAYFALLRQVGDAGKRDLKQEDLQFLEAVQRRCGIPVSGQAAPRSEASRNCVKSAYEAPRAVWVLRLTSPLSEEASRPIERHIALQRSLQQLGFLPTDALIDGVYGAGTREAIAQWQRSENHNITGVIADAEASLLEQAASRHRSATTLIQPIASNQAADKADDRQRQPIPAQLQPGAKRTAFANTYHVVAWPTYDELRANPFPFKDKVVGVDALFSRMISENEGMFGDLLVINLPSSQFKEEGRRYMLAIKVLGIRSIKTPMGVEFPAAYGSYVGAYECGNLFVRCSE